MERAGIDCSGDNPDIRDALSDQSDNLVAEALLKVDRRSRIGGQKSPEWFREKFRQGIGVAEEADMAARAICIARKIVLHPLCSRQEILRMCKQGMTCRRQRHALAAALHQLCTKRRLDVAQACAGGGQRRVSAQRAGRDAAGFCDVPEQAQVIKIRANHSILRILRILSPEYTDLCAVIRSLSSARHEVGGNTMDQDLLLSACLVTVVIGLWATALLPEYLVALIFFATVAMLRLAPPDVLFSGFSSAAFWLILSGFVLGTAIRKVGLADRVAGLLAGHLAGSWPRMVGGVVLLTYALAFVMPSNMGRIALLMPIVMAFADRVGLGPDSRGRTGLALAVGFGTFQLSASILPANVPNLVMTGAAESAYGFHLSYLTYLTLHAPVLGLLKGAALTLCISVLFPASPRALDDIPPPAPMTVAEWRLAGLLLVTLGLWMTDGVHRISPAWIGLAAACLCLIPRIGFLNGDEFAAGVNVRTCLYIAGILGLAAFVAQSGIGARIGTALVAFVPLDPASPMRNFGALVGLITSLNFVVTANGVPALYTPLAQSLASSSGFTLATVLMIQVIGYSTPLLPYQASPIVVAMGMAKVPARDGIKLCLMLAAITFLVLTPIDYVWFGWLGWI